MLLIPTLRENCFEYNNLVPTTMADNSCSSMDTCSLLLATVEGVGTHLAPLETDRTSKEYQNMH